MIVSKSKFKTKIGTMYCLWKSSGNDINIIFMGNNKKSYMSYLSKLKRKNKDLGQVIFNEKKSGKIESVIRSYLNGKNRKINLKCEFLLGTEFEKEVWNKLASVLYGETTSYKKLAESIGHPYAYRAVGSALAKNPIMLVTPCHRVIKSNGKIGKFSGGGESIKKFLLALEQST